MPRRCRAFAVVFLLATAACGRPDAVPDTPDAAAAQAGTAHATVTADSMAALGRAGRALWLAGPWRFRAGDDPAWASPDVDDSDWGLVDPARALPDSLIAAARAAERAGGTGMAWLRYRLTVDAALLGEPLGLRLINKGAAEVYINGRRAVTLGDVAAPPRRGAVRFGWMQPPIAVTLPATETLVAVRINVASVDALLGQLADGLYGAALEAPQAQSLRLQREGRRGTAWTLLAGFLFALGAVHILLYAFLRRPRSNLYFGAFALLLAIAACVDQILPFIIDDAWLLVAATMWLVLPGSILALPVLLAFLNATFFGRVPRYFFVAFGAGLLLWLLTGLRLLTGEALDILFPIFSGILALEALRVTGLAVWRRRPGARILAAGVLVLAAAVFLEALLTRLGSGSAWPMVVGFAGLALSGSIHIAHRFALASRKLEQLTNHLEAEVRQRTRELEDAKLAAESASRTKSQFLANMSHELRTPLNAIIGYSEMLVEEAGELGHHELVPDLRKIHTSGRHLLGLINDVLDLSKIEAGRMEMYLEPFDVAEAVREVATTIEPLVRKNGNTLELGIEPGVGTIHADQVKVRQILFNLLSNATKFTENGTVGVHAARRDGPAGERMVISISDTGIGMTHEQVGRLFQPFTQADASTTKKYGGTGLGLTITKRFAEMMGGSVAVSSAPGSGTTFVVDLPVEVREPASLREEAGMAAGDEFGGDGFAGDGGGATILVVDDDPAAREMISRTLLREGYRVITAADGDEGLRLAAEQRPALITLDVMMPVMDGWSVLSRLKADPELAEIPVVIVSVVDDRSLAFSLGATEYMTKPVDRERLGGLLRRLLGPGSDGPVLLVEDDAATRELLRRLLEKEQCTVLEAGNGREALEVAAEVAPALVLLDLMMPEMDGFAFLREFRSRPGCEHTPVVVLTAKDLTDEDRRALHGAATRILQKGHHSGAEVVDEVRRQLALYMTPT
jgi:signal transduction histidine kinase/DNA-binding response OmpR family regulator